MSSACRRSPSGRTRSATTSSVIEAGLWGLAAASTLVIGAWIGLSGNVSRRFVGLVMAFGVGALISALAFDLTEEAFRIGGTLAVASGLGAGGLTFYQGNRLLDQRRRGREIGAPDGNGPAIVLGALLDGIPESIVLGSTLLAGTGVSFPFLAAVAISNAPEALTAAADLRREGHRPGWVIRVWIGVALASGAAAALGYGILGDMGGSVWVPFIQAFAAGAILTMLVDTMIPEAFADGGNLVGLVTVLGFASAFFLTSIN
jgi:zinc transporter, ZIP family